MKVRRIAIVGGGITGLAAAHRLRELAPSVEVRLFEASARAGGVLRTERIQGMLVERSADMFTTREPWAIQLCQRLGLADQIISTNPNHRRALVVHDGQLVPVPEGFALLGPSRVWPIVTTPLLSWRGKLRLGWEYFTPARRAGHDESLASFATRRLGREVYERIVQPLVGGIYTADPARLSMAATMPQFMRMERECGGLIRGARKPGGLREGARPHETGEPTGVAGTMDGEQRGEQASGARYGQFVTLRDGMSSLVDRLVERIGSASIRLGSVVERLERLPDRTWQLRLAGNVVPYLADAVLICVSATQAARLIQDTDDQLASDLAGIRAASAAVAVLGYDRRQIGHPLDGFGFVVPAIERRRILAGSFASVKFAGRAPEGRVLLRIFVGGALQPELLSLSDDALLAVVREELQALIQARGEPDPCELIRWHDTMPQYHVGHLELVARIEERTARLAGVAIAGNSYRGVGIPFCIHDGEQAAERVLS